MGPARAEQDCQDKQTIKKKKKNQLDPVKQGRANRFFLMGNLDYYAPLEKYEIVKNLEE